MAMTRDKAIPRHRSPPRPKGRLDVVDAVRALALLGVLVMNLRDMAGLDFMSAEALRAVQSRLDIVIDKALLVFVDKKALSAFSFLFGLSFSLLLASAIARGGTFLPMYARRLVALAAFGVLNFAFFYWGDILITYAALGGLLVIAVRLPQRLVLALSAILLLGVPALLAVLGATQAPDVQTAADVAALRAFGSPDWLDAVRHGIARYLRLAGTEGAINYWEYTNILGLFLLGLWTGRRGIANDIGGNRRFLRRIAAVALPVGILASIVQVALPQTSPLATLMLVSKPVLAIGYLAAAALVLDLDAAARPREALAKTGRLALTNYLAYGLFGQILFYGWALGWLGQVGTSEVVLLALLVYALLLALSALWLVPFRIGPAEWLWRCLTHLSVQPLRRPEPAPG